MKVRIEVLEAATQAGVRVVKDVNVTDESLAVGDVRVFEAGGKIELREYGVGRAFDPQNDPMDPNFATGGDGGGAGA